MQTHVPRETLNLGGRKAECSSCGFRPAVQGQRYCRPCRAEYNRNRRRGKIEVLLTPEEWAAVKAFRAAGIRALVQHVPDPVADCPGRDAADDG